MFGRLMAGMLLLGSLFALSACNTVNGVGQDISGSARTVQRAL